MLEIRKTDLLEMTSRQAFNLEEMHRDEVAVRPDIMKVAPNKQRYSELDKAGKLLPLIALLDGEIIGYSINIIDKNLHYESIKSCINDLFYVRKQSRAAYGLKLKSETVKYARQLGCTFMLWRAKEGSQWEKILRLQGAKVQDILLYEEI